MNKPLKLILLFSVVFSLTACSEKKQYEEAVLAEMQNEPDLKDYKLDPAAMATCVIEGTTRNMPGVFAGDPKRLQAYLSYVKMISLKKAKDPAKAMDELRNEFGSAKALMEARSNYTDNFVECQATLITNTEPVDKSATNAAAAVVTPVPAVASPVSVAPAVAPVTENSQAQ